MFAPIVLFGFNRPYHTKLSLESLSNNKESNESDLFVFIDGPKSNSQSHLINNVETVVNSYKNSFKSIVIYKSETNLGSASNLRNGITKIFKTYNNAIFIEDDIVVSNYFLEYMNYALTKYENYQNVWHINGFNFPIKSENNDCYFSRVMFCWGWATWKNRWLKHIENPLSHDPFYLKNFFNKSMLKGLDLNGNNKFFSCQIKQNCEGKNTWAIFWYAFIYCNKGLCLTPYFSLTRNMGHDGSGLHCRENKTIQNQLININPINNFPDTAIEDLISLKKMKNYIKKTYSFRKKIFRFIRSKFS